MARGWESKSVESQREDAQADVAGEEPYLAPEERDRKLERSSLELTRRRVEAQLAATKSAAHRQALEHALRHLDDELAKLS